MSRLRPVLARLGGWFGLAPEAWELDPACHECDACTAPVRDVASLVLADGDWRPVERLVPHICGG